MDTHVISGESILERMVTRLAPDQRVAFEAGRRCGYVVLGPGQQELGRVWAVWCMRQQRPDIRVEDSGEYSVVTMHLGPARRQLSGDGMVAVRRAFERFGDKVMHYQTRNWCKHPQVKPHGGKLLAQRLVEIAFLDGVESE
jgi:hypothetical protein